MADNVTRPEDKQNFTLLMAKLREKLDEQEAKDGKKLLSYVCGRGRHGVRPNSFTDLNAPLYTPNEASPQYKWSCDDAVELWLNKGFPKSKIVMGVPFYGIKFNGVSNTNSGIYQTFKSGGSLSYDSIASGYLNNPQYSRFVHPDAHAPLLFNGSTFISYDDADSIAERRNI